MLQSSIYPESYGVPSEYFFVVKFLFKSLPDTKDTIKFMKIHLNIEDKNRNKETGEYKKNIVPIDRKLNRNEGLLLVPGGPTKEHNILLYVANLKAKVTGYIEYQKVGAEKA